MSELIKDKRSMNKEELDAIYNYELPMKLYDTTLVGEKNTVLIDMVNIIKKNGNIFLLGYPTNKITMLILKLYHENIVRIINKPSASTLLPLMFMTGLLELKDDDYIYVTISESKKEGKDYQKKFKMFYSLLVNSGCTVEFIEGEEDISDLVVENYNTLPTDFSENAFRNNIINEQLVFLNQPNDYNYSSIIKNYPIKIKLIQSTEYIKKREEQGISFIPFKNYKDSKVECIYGSLCVESKLFGYMYNQGKKWSDVKGYVAYWIGSQLPPNHILKKYSYIKTSTVDCHSQESDFDMCRKTEEDEKIEQMLNISLDLLEDSTLSQLNDACNNTTGKDDGITINNTCKEIMTNAVQPIALTCPGCYMNWQSYINNIQIKWDNSVCTTISTSGGRRIKKTKKKTKKNKRNKKKRTKSITKTKRSKN